MHGNCALSHNRADLPAPQDHPLRLRASAGVIFFFLRIFLHPRRLGCNLLLSMQCRRTRGGKKDDFGKRCISLRKPAESAIVQLNTLNVGRKRADEPVHKACCIASTCASSHCGTVLHAVDGCRMSNPRISCSDHSPNVGCARVRLRWVRVLCSEKTRSHWTVVDSYSLYPCAAPGVASGSPWVKGSLIHMLIDVEGPTRRCSRRSGLSRAVRSTARAIPSRG